MKQIGTYEVREDKVIHCADYECAAWWEKRQIRAGTYPVLKDDNFVYVHIPAVVVESYFGALWCGTPISRKPYDTKQDAGRATTYTLVTYDYLVAESLATNQETPWSIPGYAPTPHQYPGKEWNSDRKEYEPCTRTMYLLKPREEVIQ